MENTNLKILFVSAEAAPFAKVGGLGDVAYALPLALRRIGIDARVALPYYRTIALNHCRETTPGPACEDVKLLNSTFKFSLRQITSNGLPFILHDLPALFNRDGVYGYYDDPQRFTAFCKAVIAGLKDLDWRPDVIHCNDWQTALIPALLNNVHSGDPFFGKTATVFSIHNLAYQGVVPADFIGSTGLPREEFDYRKVEFFGKFNFMKAGIFYSDRVATVSKKYAEEILTPEYGYGLDTMLAAHKHKLTGIVNGIDTDIFNPETDPNIPARFSAADFAAKKTNKAALLRELGFSAEEKDLAAPVIGMVTRIVEQKGFDLIGEILAPLLKHNIRLAILGDGDEKYTSALTAAAAKHPAKMTVRGGFNEPLARRIYAGSDIFLMPSKYEPCGLGQMIAMRYGTVPLVRATGGLADTVANFNPATGQGDGFVFEPYTGAALMAAMKTALASYKRKKAWNALIANIMSKDFSWESSAGKYSQLYQDAISKQNTTRATQPQ